MTEKESISIANRMLIVETCTYYRRKFKFSDSNLDAERKYVFANLCLKE